MKLSKFKEEYLYLKNEKLLTDQEIEEELGISHMGLYHLKQYAQIDVPKRPRKNALGFTEEMLQKGESIGLSRRLMYKRVRDLFWKHERAISEPKNVRGGTKHDRTRIDSEISVNFREE